MPPAAVRGMARRAGNIARMPARQQTCVAAALHDSSTHSLLMPSLRLSPFLARAQVVAKQQQAMQPLQQPPPPLEQQPEQQQAQEPVQHR